MIFFYTLLLLLLLLLSNINSKKIKYDTNNKGKYQYNSLNNADIDDDIIDDDDNIDYDNNISKPFEEIASYLLRTSNNNNDYDFSKYRLNEITKALSKLAASQVSYLLLILFFSLYLI